ncbi:MAG: tetraacyldisaccharide 4'-kinase [Bacteroidia bacterium]|nr:tetraacyldisaccharide 4'-kinase [Bacteroidia bacterium]
MRPWLLPLSPLYGAGARLYAYLYDTGLRRAWQAPVPVISVGNIAAGGTGKTPVVSWLITSLRAMGYQPAYLSRGYGRMTRGFRLVSPGDQAATVGDEALMISQRHPETPVGVCEDRQTGIQHLTSVHFPDLILLDDAFQHRRVARDLDWVVIDATIPPYRDSLLPGGSLREPIGALRRADLLIISKWTHPAQAEEVRTHLAWLDKPVAACQPVWTSVAPAGTDVPVSPEVLADRPVILVSGIGNPAFFETQARQYGANVLHHLIFADHHPYTAGEVTAILRVWQAHSSQQPWLLTTEKDATRLLPVWPASAPVPHVARLTLTWLPGWADPLAQVAAIPGLQP